MKTGNQLPRPGDIVEIRTRMEILQTLDVQGMLGGLPFMPEMIRFCGKRFYVSRRIEKTCCEMPAMEMRAFEHNDVVCLAGLRCSGTDHGKCQNGCQIFWKSAWLRKVDKGNQCPHADNEESLALVERLKTSRGSDQFVCQATELARATVPISRIGKLWKCIRDVWGGTYSVCRMLTSIGGPVFCKVRRRIRGDWPRGKLQRTPTEGLNLQPGEWVEVKPIEEIIGTLDAHGKNRGLHFSEDMAEFCGCRYRVRNRLERMIDEATGRMREVKNTVILEGVVCGCTFTLGGCPRKLHQYWREIWLKRAPSPERGIQNGESKDQ